MIAFVTFTVNYSATIELNNDDELFDNELLLEELDHLVWRNDADIHAVEINERTIVEGASYEEINPSTL